MVKKIYYCPHCTGTIMYLRELLSVEKKVERIPRPKKLKKEPSEKKEKKEKKKYIRVQVHQKRGPKPMTQEEKAARKAARYDAHKQYVKEMYYKKYRERKTKIGKLEKENKE